MTVNLSLLGGAGWQFLDNNGSPLSGGLLYTYVAGTTTPQTTYTNNAGVTANTNPIVLDSAGRIAGGEIWLTQGQTYKFVLKTSASITVGTYDNISGASDPANIYAVLAAPSGSSLIGYLPAGTNAVATTVQAKLRESVSVLDFGAIASTRTEVPSLAVQQSNTAAFNSAILYLLSIGGGELIVPDDVFHTYGTIDLTLNSYTPPFVDYSRPPIQITGLGSSTIYQNHPTAPLFRTLYVELKIRNINLCGRGSTTTGNMVEYYSVQAWELQSVTFRGVAGRAIFLAGSERGVGENLYFYNVRQAIVHNISGANNETYFSNIVVISPGYTQDPVTGGNVQNFTSNPPDRTSGTYTQSNRAAIHLGNCVNNRFSGGSIKATASISGIKYKSGEQTVVENFYIEGFGNGAINPSVIVGGASEQTTLAESITTASTTFNVTDTKWFTNFAPSAPYAGDTSLAYVIYDPSNVTVFEVVEVLYFNNTQACSVTRGTNGTSAAAWASGVVIREWLGDTSISDLAIYDNHLESYQTLPPASTLTNTVALGQTNGEVILGNVWDQFHRSVTQIPNNNYTLITSNNRTRNFGLPNSGRIQTWGPNTVSVIAKEPGAYPYGFTGVIVQSDSTVGSTTWSNFAFKSASTNFLSNSSNNVSAALAFAENSVTFGGYGQTFIVNGDRGIGFAVTSSQATRMASVDEKTFPGLKYKYFSGGNWLVGSALTQNGIVLGDGGSSVTILFGTGDPNGSQAANPGSLYLNLSGGANVSLYVKESGVGTNTGWVGK